MFRYVRYNPRATLRPALKRDETSESAVAVELRMPRRAMRLGTLDPETSEIIWRDEVADGIATIDISSSPTPHTPAPS